MGGLVRRLCQNVYSRQVRDHFDALYLVAFGDITGGAEQSSAPPVMSPCGTRNLQF
jgi:hypothetical protein